jgi:phage host-nuclease inhibitor protein Gam
MNDAIAHITATYQPVMEALCKQVDPLRAGVQAFCEANRVELCGKGKTANLVTGEVQWRQRPPSVTLKAVETVIKTLRRLRLKRFVRVKMEVNKEAILLEPDAVKDVLGITVVTGVEDFVITPFEQEVAA